MTWLWILIGVVAFIIIVAAVGYPLVRKARTKRLKEQFGPEYDRTVDAADSRGGQRASSVTVNVAGNGWTSVR